MPVNSLFPRGATSEQNLVEGLIIESIKMYGQEFYYIPRTLVAVDEILGEDSLSEFNNAYQIEAYVDNVDGFGGAGAFMSKFGLFIEEQAQLTIARRRWEQLVGQHGTTVIPDRPAEGDLLYFPLTKGLFEIKFVEHQNPFYQLGRLYVYKLKVELFQYSSERINTDVEEINQIALDMTFDINGTNPSTALPEKRDYFSNTELESAAGTGDKILNFDEHNPFGE
jgi:Virus neck protein